MSISLLTLAVIAASSLAWAGFDATRKRLTTTLEPIPLVIWLMLGQLGPFALWVAFDGLVLPSADYVAPALATIALNVVANVAFVRAVQLSPLSVIIPLLSITPVVSAAIAWLVLGEVPAAGQTIGLLAIVIGAIGLQANHRASPVALIRAWRAEPGAPWMAAVAVLWSASAVFDKDATAASSEAVHGFILCAGIAVSLLTWLAARRQLASLGGARRAPSVLVAAVVCGTVALALQLVAFQLTLVSLVEAIKRAIGMITALLVGRLFFNEAVPMQRVVAVLIMACGGALLVGTGTAH